MIFSPFPPSTGDAGGQRPSPASISRLPRDALARPSSSSSPSPPSTILALLLCLGLEAALARPGCWESHPSACAGGAGRLLGTPCALELSPLPALLPGVSRELGLTPERGGTLGWHLPIPGIQWLPVRVPWGGMGVPGRGGRPGGPWENVWNVAGMCWWDLGMGEQRVLGPRDFGMWQGGDSPARTPAWVWGRRELPAASHQHHPLLRAGEMGRNQGWKTRDGKAGKHRNAGAEAMMGFGFGWICRCPLGSSKKGENRSEPSPGTHIQPEPVPGMALSCRSNTSGTAEPGLASPNHLFFFV